MQGSCLAHFTSVTLVLGYGKPYLAKIVQTPEIKISGCEVYQERDLGEYDLGKISILKKNHYCLRKLRCAVLLKMIFLVLIYRLWPVQIYLYFAHVAVHDHMIHNSFFMPSWTYMMPNWCITWIEKCSLLIIHAKQMVIYKLRMLLPCGHTF